MNTCWLVRSFYLTERGVQYADIGTGPTIAHALADAVARLTERNNNAQ